jgi:hypothetical protein
MRQYLALVLLCTANAAVQADEPAAPAAPAPKSCLTPDNKVLGPRSGDRPLPLLSGDPQHGFHSACAVAWSTLSPKNEALPVAECFQGSLLRLDHVSACGLPPGPLWVSSRWVITSAELSRATSRAATCQQLETGAWAGTRDLNLECIPQKKANAQADAARPAPAPATAPASTPNH